MLCDGEGRVKISDFGSAKMYELYGENRDASVRSVGDATVGTPAFTAPEFAMHEAAPNMKNVFCGDGWSLGVTLYYMVFGKAPFRGATIFEMFENICTKPVVFPATPKASKECKTLIDRMLVKDPHRRANIEMIWNDPWLKGGARYNEVRSMNDQELSKIIISQADLKMAIKRTTTTKNFKELQKP
mmetsp:Transcript_7963/g.20848  ORF Transcript_7963/g.20848 Transcript_7963/m.20848 type:complete len:186 (+) Transcript_7963:1645-2202(+)